MKKKPSTFLKQMFSLIVTMVKAKTMAMKSKTSAFKARLLIFNLLRNKKVLMSTIAKEKEDNCNRENHNKAIVLYNNAANKIPPSMSNIEAVKRNEEDEDNDYPDLKQSLYELEDEDEDDELVNGKGSIIDLVRKSREDGNDFSLEDEIDHVADVFIRRFHRQMRMQKQESFKRNREMLARGG